MTEPTPKDLRECYANRQKEYPNLEDLLVALYEKEEGDDSFLKTLSEQRLRVKAKYPKPE
tara:strand:+ start:589 stop:768 length:180 start_codon:yes stop_codon:yes gene_type:complete